MYSLAHPQCKRIKMVHLGLGYKTNKESNDYLRRLWAVTRREFGKIAWDFSPQKTGNTVFLGFADINIERPVEFTLKYKQKGCLNEIFVDKIQNDEIAIKIERCLKQAIKEPELKWYSFAFNISHQCVFTDCKGKHFSLSRNKIEFSVKAYDLIDAKYVFADRMQTMCAILSFYLLCPILQDDSLNDMIGLHKRNLEITDDIATTIDAFLEREYLYENDISLLESAMIAFAQGIKSESMSYKVSGIDFPFSETAVVDYMSALEIITTHDIEPTKCPDCGQLKFSIAKKVMNLAISYNPEMKDRMKRWVTDYYDIRSKYVHTGKRMSRNNYMGVSTPLMSVSHKRGVIMQHSIVDPSLKEDVRNMILFHENLPLIETC